MTPASDPAKAGRPANRAYHAFAAGLTGFCVAASLSACDAAPRATATEARRVVSLSPVGTEIVLALGRGERLVAVDAASTELPGAPGLPVTEASAAAAHSPDLVLVPAAEAAAARRAVPSARVLEVAVHDFDEGYALCLSVGAALGRGEEARRFVWETSRPLAKLGAESFGERRPRVAAVLALEPLEIAGGHNFLTSLIELAGGESVTHGTDQPRLAWSAADLARAAPELVVLVTPQSPSTSQRDLARALFADEARVEFLALDAERDWLTASLPAARRLRGWIEELD
jgi:ABC-type hemin transport system substrate-binding protein